MEQTIPTERSAYLRIFMALIGEFERFVRILTTRFLLLMSARSRSTNTTQIARLVVFSFRVFLFLSLRVSDCTTAREIWVRLQSYYEGTVQVKTKLFKTYKSEYENFSVGWRVCRCHVFSLFVNCEQDAGKQATSALS